MNTASASNRGRAGFTLVETMVSVTLVCLFFGGAILAFAQLIRANDRAQARMDATANARAALDTAALEVKRAKLLPADQAGFPPFVDFFRADTQVFPAADRTNQDADLATDEEVFEGADDDSDWILANDDNHARIPAGGLGLAYYERPFYRSERDFGDGHVDIDTRFSSSTLIFDTFPSAAGLPARRVGISVGPDPDGGPNQALLLEVRESDPLGIEPDRLRQGVIAHNVLAFTALCYDARSSTATAARTNPYRTNWDAGTLFSTRSDRNLFPALPVSLLLSVTVQVDPRVVSGNGPLETVSLDTVVNIEAVLRDPRYDNNLRNTVLFLGP